jgi:hypothetical protein
MRIPYSGEQQNTGLSGPRRSSLFSHPHHLFPIACSATEEVVWERHARCPGSIRAVPREISASLSRAPTGSKCREVPASLRGRTGRDRSRKGGGAPVWARGADGIARSGED